jgi:7-keto-8-aminopelargonate synthetase-like enzyme
LRALLQNSQAPRKIIVSDAVYSMDGDVADVQALLLLAREFDAVLLLDDAHGTGTLGSTGRGALEFWRERRAEFDRALEGIALVQTGTLSKSLGSQGGFVAASHAVCDWLVNAGRPFVYSTGLTPSACGAALQSLRMLQREPQRTARLRDVSEQLACGLQSLGFDAPMQPSPIVAVVVGESEAALQLSDALLKRGLWCPAIRPPTVPHDAARLRVTANASLTDDEIAHALEIFGEVRSNSTVL